MENSNALTLLQNTYPSDDEGCECENEQIGDPRTGKSSTTESLDLPVPERLLSFLTDATENSEFRDDQDLHDGRIRSFPHERGNWAACLYVPIQRGESIEALCNQLLPCLRIICDFHKCSDFHVSFTRTVVLRHHWIPLFVDDIRGKIGKCERFPMDFEELEVFVNDEKTRTFLALKVNFGCDMLLQLVRSADKTLSEFKLPGYYEDPSFHASILWCVGDKKEDLCAMKSTLQKQFNELRKQNPYLWSVDVREVHCKIGNRLYRFELRNHAKEL